MIFRQIFMVLAVLTVASGCAREPGEALSSHGGDPSDQIASVAATLQEPSLLYFFEPTLDGAFLDLCERVGSSCGASAADRFCRHHGYERARSHVASYAGERGPTKTIVSGARCERRCQSFNEIVCENRLERNFVNPTLRGLPLDNCKSFGRGCGMPAATSYCKSKGFERAVAFGVYRDGVRRNTALQAGAQKQCEGESCGAFRYVRCTPIK